MSLRTGISRIGRLAAMAGMTGLLVAGLATPLAGHAAASTQGTIKDRDFVIVSVAGNTAPTTMVVQRGPDSPEITVAISTTTTLVRRFDGKSDLTELSAGDHVLISGSRPDAKDITATGIKDNSIQVGYSQINGRVLFVGRGLERMVLRVTANEGTNAAFGRGENVTLDVSASTKVDLLGNPNATVADVRPGMVLTCWGLSNREGHIMFAPHDITQVLPAGANALTKAAPSDNTPK